MKRDLVDELYKTAYKRYREKYPNKDFASKIGRASCRERV